MSNEEYIKVMAEAFPTPKVKQTSWRESLPSEITANPLEDETEEDMGKPADWDESEVTPLELLDPPAFVELDINEVQLMGDF